MTSDFDIYRAALSDPMPGARTMSVKGLARIHAHCTDTGERLVVAAYGRRSLHQFGNREGSERRLSLVDWSVKVDKGIKVFFSFKILI
jgi:hypothetical protein